MIIELKELLGKVVTIKTLTGLEMIGTLISTNDDNNLIVLTHPRMVVLSNTGDNENNSIAVVPFTFTSITDQISFTTDKVLSVSETIKESAEDYLKIVGEKPEKKKKK